MRTGTERWTVEVDEAILGRNAQFAATNRERFGTLGLRVINIASSPGSGKTALLERTLNELAGELRIGVIVGDLQTDNDARRLGDKGAPVVQVTTNGYCHLEASMIAQAMAELDVEKLDLLIIENVGNLVCPASFDLGEAERVVLISVTEGEDKPLKYPVIFEKADAVVITKIDMTEAAGIDIDVLRDNVRRTAPRARLLELSSRSGEGFGGWLSFLGRSASAT